MADNTIGRVNVEITGNAAPLKESLKQAESATQQTAAKMNASFGAVGRGGAFDGIAKGIKDSTAGVRNLLSAVVGVVGAFTRMLGLVGLVVTAVTTLAYGAKKVWDHFTGAADEAARIEENLKNAAAAYERYVERVRNAAKSLPAPNPNTGVLDPEGVNSDAKRAAELVKDIELRKKTRRDFSIQQRELEEIEQRRIQRRNVELRSAEIERQNEAKSAEDEAAKEEIAITALRMKHLKEVQEERMKHEEEFRKYNLETQLLIIKKTRERNAEIMAHQRAESAARRKMAAEFAAELTNAFNQANNANKAASDAMMERMAYSINRLKEIAEAGQGSRHRGDTSTAGGQW